MKKNKKKKRRAQDSRLSLIKVRIHVCGTAEQRQQRTSRSTPDYTFRQFEMPITATITLAGHEPILQAFFAILSLIYPQKAL